MAAAAASAKQKLEAEVTAYRDLQQVMTKVENARQQCAQQLSENDMVMKELELVEEDASVYKLVGPLLVKQDLVEARANVGKRLEFITSESERLDNQLTALETKLGEKQKEIVAAQRRMQAAPQQAGAAAAGAAAASG